MTSDNLLEKLFEKHKITSQEEKDKVIDIIKDKKDVEKIEKVILSFSDKLNLAEQIISVLPLYYDKSGLWWKWNSSEHKWEMVDEVDLMNYVTYSSPANTINSKERNEIIQGLKQKSRELKPKDAPNTWIQFGDEVIDIETGDRFKASAEYFLTNPIPHKIGYSDETPNIDRIFKEWVGDEWVLTLKQIIAYCMLRDYPIHRIFCFIGAGMNGKSKYLELLRTFIGNANCCSTELDTLLTSRFEVTRLHKKLVCQMGETNFNEMNKTSQLKKLSGGDLIGFEYKNKNPFEEINYAKILIATNNLPATNDKTIGFYRRWSIIDFPNQFTEKKDILTEIPAIEYNNLANYCVSILMDLLSNRSFNKEGSIEERTKKYEDHSNPLEKFLKEFTKEDYDGQIWKNDFSKKIKEWCREKRFREISDVEIGKKMKELKISQIMKVLPWDITKKGRCWVGIDWKDNAE